MTAIHTGCETSPASGREAGRGAALVFFGTVALLFTAAAVAVSRRAKTAAPASSTPPPSTRQIDGAVLTIGTKNVPVAARTADEIPAR